MKPIPYPLRGEWLITEEGADLIMHVWRTAHTTGKAERIALALEARDGKPLENQRNFVTLPSGIVVMDVDGPLMRKAELFSDISGATSYQWISARLDECRASSSAVRKLVIRANSPGGEAAGVGECGEKITRLIEAGWHVEGYVETQAASAMWWLLSQCSHITAHPTAQVGWIGAVRRLRDDSEQDEKAGVKVHELISKGAEKKRTLPMDESVIARFQSNTDDWGALFTAAVARGRGVTTAKVLKDFGGGFGMFAAAALDVGMIDDVANFEETIARLTGARTSTSTSSPAAARAHRGDIMAIEKLTAGGDSEWQCAGCNEMMGPSAKSYCAKCADDDGDEDDDEDEDEAKALGLEPKAPAAQRRERMIALVALEERVFAATETKTHAAAMGRLAAVVADVTSCRRSAPSSPRPGRRT
jgi:ClpP class serine protease